MDQNTQTEQNNEIPMFQYSTFEQIEKALQKKGLKTRVCVTFMVCFISLGMNPFFPGGLLKM